MASVFQYAGPNNSWSIKDPTIYDTDSPQWLAVTHRAAGMRRYTLSAALEVDPVISGDNYIGGTLSVTSNGTYRKGTPSGYTYQWTNNGVSIGGATSSSYVLVAGDLADTILCEQVATINGVAQAARSSNSYVGWEVPPTIVATNVGFDTIKTSYAAPLPASISAGNLLILYLTNVNTAGAPTIDTPTDWTLVGTETQGDARTSIFFKIASGSEGATVTVTQGSGRPTSISQKITGHDAAQAPEVTFAANSNDPPEHTPSWGAANNRWIAGASGRGEGSTTAPTYSTGYGANQLTHTNTNSDGGKIALASKYASAVSDDPDALTGAVPTATDAIAFTLAIKPA